MPDAILTHHWRAGEWKSTPLLFALFSVFVLSGRARALRNPNKIGYSTPTLEMQESFIREMVVDIL